MPVGETQPTPSFIFRLRRALGATGSRGLVLMTILVAVASLVEVLGMTAVMQFMALVSRPEELAREPFLSIRHWTGLQSFRDFILGMGIALMAFLGLGKAMSAYVQWYRHRFVWRADSRMAVQLMESFLSRPYRWLLDQNSAHLNRHLNTTLLVEFLLIPLTECLAAGVLAAIILGALLLIDPMVALVAGVSVGSAHTALVALTRSPMRRWAREGHTLLNRRATLGHEAVAGFKPILSASCESYYAERFTAVSERGSRLAAWRGMLWEIPRFALEAVALWLILSLTLYFVLWGGQDRLLPMLSLYAMAGYRLIPAFHQLFQAINMIRTGMPELEAYLGFLDECPRRDLAPPEQGLALRESLRLEKLGFDYGPGATVLRDVDFLVERSQSVGIVGHTGSGKSTLIDILMGLLEPSAGRLCVDGRPVDQELRRCWRSSVGYVPQAVYLKDDSILANVAFGLPENSVDRGLAMKALEAARLDEFVSSLELGLDSPVGENGVRLSGGQRQRLGIARALYHDPELLIFDEATSSLDNVTEREVMLAIEELSGKKTVVLVAHRIETVRQCDRIYVLEKGRIIASGSYDELMKTSRAFQALALSDAKGSRALGQALATEGKL